MSQHISVSNEYTAGIARFVSGLRYEDIPSEVIDRIKLLILDSLGCAVFGSVLPWSRILMDTLGEVDTTQGCTLWGTDRKLSAPHAALVNGTLVQSFELDDVHRVGVLHVGAVTLPALLAVTEMRPGMTGKDFLTAAVAGYEIGPRVGMCMGQEHIGQGWHSGATVGVFSACAAASRALGLDPDRTVHALGITGTQSAGLMAAQFGAMVKRMHAGRSSQSGLYGALLAERGFTGIVDLFENEYGGFCTTFSASLDKFDRRELTSGLGKRWETTRIALKFYSCVGSNHTTLDAIRAMQSRHPFGVEDIDRIVVHGSRVTVDHVGWPYVPQGLTSAQLNLPYCVAVLLLEGDVFVDQFSEELVADPRRIEVSRLVEVVEDPSITARGKTYRHMVKVEVFLRDGTRLEETRESPEGSEHSFASTDTVVNKFRKLASRRIGTEAAERLAEALLRAETLPDAGEIVKLLAATGARESI